MEDIGISHEMIDIVISVQITMVHSRTNTIIFAINDNVYPDLRTQYISSKYYGRPSVYNLIELLPQTIYNLVLFLVKAFERRNAFIIKCIKNAVNIVLSIYICMYVYWFFSVCFDSKTYVLFI